MKFLTLFFIFLSFNSFAENICNIEVKLEKLTDPKTGTTSIKHEYTYPDDSNNACDNYAIKKKK